MTLRECIADWILGGEYRRVLKIANDACFLMIERHNLAAKRYAALESIAANTCCGTCQEAARVAKEALK